MEQYFLTGGAFVLYMIAMFAFYDLLAWGLHEDPIFYPLFKSIIYRKRIETEWFKDRLKRWSSVGDWSMDLITVSPRMYEEHHVRQQILRNETAAGYEHGRDFCDRNNVEYRRTTPPKSETFHNRVDNAECVLKNKINKNPFDWMGAFYDGWAKVRIEERYNFVSEEGQLMATEWYDWVSDFANGVASIKSFGKYNIIDTTGRTQSTIWFDNIGHIWTTDRFIPVWKNGKKNLIDRNGRLFSKIWFDWINNFSKHDTYTECEINGRRCKIDVDGEIIEEDNFERDSSIGSSNMLTGGPTLYLP